MENKTTLKINNSANIDKMLTSPVGPLILKLAVPTILSMMVTAIYNMADTFFVSQLGTSASGAVGIIFSIMAIIQAVGFTIGMGSGAMTSRHLGAKNFEKANVFCSTAVFLAFFCGLFLGTIGILFNSKIVKYLGATPTILPYAQSYAQYIFIAFPFMCTTFVLNNQMRFQGMAAKSMIGILSGGILNIFLDPLFIFGFKMGIKGAAIATMLSQMVSFSILLSFFLRRKTNAALSIKSVSKEFSVYRTILKIGFPSLCRQGIASMSAIFLNVAAGHYGDAAVAGMSITNRVMMFVLAMGIGLGQGFQPVVAMNFGAKKMTRVREAYNFTCRITFSIMTLFMIVIMFFAPEIVALFRDDIDVINVGKVALRCQAIGLPLFTYIFPTNMLLQTTGKAKSATFLSSLRQGVCFLPLILTMPRFFGLFGVEISQAISDVVSSLITIPFAIAFFKEKHFKTESENQHDEHSDSKLKDR